MAKVFMGSVIMANVFMENLTETLRFLMILLVPLVYRNVSKWFFEIEE